jgi:hypothetical protein
MVIFAKFCCIVGQIVVGAIIGLLWARFAFPLMDWLYTGVETSWNKWKSRGDRDPVPAK